MRELFTELAIDKQINFEVANFVYPALAAKYHVALVPFLLQGVAGDETLNQRDGIHPTAAGARASSPTMYGTC